MQKTDLTGKVYKLASGTAFKVLDVEIYPADKVSNQYKQILTFGAGQLVAISYRGTLVPNITYSEGVMRLTKVEISGKIYKSPKATSEALGVKEKMVMYKIEEV